MKWTFKAKTTQQEKRQGERELITKNKVTKVKNQLTDSQLGSE